MEALAVQNLVIVNILAGHVLQTISGFFQRPQDLYKLYLLSSSCRGAGVTLKLSIIFLLSSHKKKTKLKRKSNSKNS